MFNGNRPVYVTSKAEGHITAGHQALKDRQVLKGNASKRQGPSLYGGLRLLGGLVLDTRV